MCNRKRGAPPALIPLISDRWTGHFEWRGQRDMPGPERLRLVDIVERAHAQDRKVRFWGTPERASLWTELHSAGVDLIGTDNLGKLDEFLAGINGE